MDWLPILSLAVTFLTAIIGAVVATKIAQINADAAKEAARQQAIPPALGSASSQMLRELLDRTHEDLTEADDERRQCERDLLACARERYRLEVNLARAVEQRDEVTAELDARKEEIARMQQRILVLASDMTAAERDIANARMLRMEAINRLQAAEARAIEAERRTSDEMNGRLALAAELQQVRAELEAERDRLES